MNNYFWYKLISIKFLKYNKKKIYKNYINYKIKYFKIYNFSNYNSNINKEIKYYKFLDKNKINNIIIKNNSILEFYIFNYKYFNYFNFKILKNYKSLKILLINSGNKLKEINNYNIIHGIIILNKCVKINLFYNQINKIKELFLSKNSPLILMKNIKQFKSIFKNFKIL